MKKEIVSDIQSISIIVLFLIGSTSIYVPGLEAEKDAWLAFILAIFLVLPMAFIYARLHYIFPNRDLFDIIEICFGKLIGKGITLIFTWYVFYWAADVLVNYGQFIHTTSLFNTPQIIPIIILGFLCAWGIQKGIEVLGRWSQLLVNIPTIILFTITLLLIPKMNIDNIRPVLQNGIRPVLKGTFSAFSLPLVQIIAFTMAFSTFKRRKSSYRVYIVGLLLGGIYMTILLLTNILVLGVNTSSSEFYPSYIAVSRINIGNTLHRIEASIAVLFVLDGFIKVSILLLCTCKGIAKIFNCPQYRFIITPIALLTITLSHFQYDSIIHYFRFASEIWSYYFFPFEVILPVIIWITAEVKKKRFTFNTNL